ncbi:hypothetical protein [Sulfurovum sp.]|uniref:hypothetical protein n=1 Tax=Sulfurovum sp. TaxID=1969726 RepID=UPI0025DC75F5|nr:hypothetical protein [Sulfurovum sp.]
MRLGLYIFAALTLMGITAALTYTVNPNNYLVEFMGINFNFPVAVWIVLPMAVLLLFTALHMVFYSLKSYFKLKKWQNDAATLEDALYWSLVNEPKEQKYTIEEIRGSAVLLGKSSLHVLDAVEGLNTRLSKVLNLINKIKGGEYVDLKEHKMSKVFSDGNPHLIRNRVNRLHHDPEFVEEVMKSSSQYSKQVQKHALDIFARNETFFKARKYAKIFDAESLHVMLARVAHEEDMGLSAEVLNDFVSAIKLNCSDFVKIVNVTKKVFTPNQNLALFKEYQNKYPKAQEAYLYLLFDYELLDEVSAYLDEHEEHEFLKFRAFYELKKSQKKFKLEDIININTICSK